MLQMDWQMLLMDPSNLIWRNPRNLRGAVVELHNNGISNAVIAARRLEAILAAGRGNTNYWNYKPILFNFQSTHSNINEKKTEWRIPHIDFSICKNNFEIGIVHNHISECFLYINRKVNWKLNSTYLSFARRKHEISENETVGRI